MPTGLLFPWSGPGYTAGTLARAAWLSTLMSETFTDIEQFEGTCYKASTGSLWDSQRLPTSPSRLFPTAWPPQKLWIKSLNRNALRILTAMDVPNAYQSALNHDTPERDLALNKHRWKAYSSTFGNTSRILAPIAAMCQFAAGVHYYGPVRWTRHTHLNPALWKPAHWSAAPLAGFQKGTKNTRRVPVGEPCTTSRPGSTPKRFPSAQPLAAEQPGTPRVPSPWMESGFATVP